MVPPGGLRGSRPDTSGPTLRERFRSRPRVGSASTNELLCRVLGKEHLPYLLDIYS